MGIEHGYETTPFSLFWEGSVHGGVWNCPYTVNSIRGISGYVLGKVYQYYDTYYSTATAAEAGGAAQSPVVNTATTITPSGTNKGDVNHNKASSDSSSSSLTSSIIVDAVPSTFGAPMPDLVRERLEILA